MTDVQSGVAGEVPPAPPAFRVMDVEDVIQEMYAKFLNLESLDAIRFPKQYALVTARAFQSPAPFDSILAALVNHATQLGIAEPASTSELPQARNQANSKDTHI